MNNSQVSPGNKPKIRRGLVLEGGGAKGAWQFGALQALDEAGIKFDYVAGTSVGALNGALWASGRLDIGEDLWGALSSSKVFKFRLFHSPMFLIGLFARIFYAYVKGFISPKDAPLSVRIFLYGLMSLPTILATTYLLFVLIRFFIAAAPHNELWRLLLLAALLALPLAGLVISRIEKGRKQYFFYASLFAPVGILVHLVRYVNGDPEIHLRGQSPLANTVTNRALLSDAIFNTMLEVPIFFWILGGTPFVVFCIAKFLRQLNTSIFSVAPLEVIIKKLLATGFKIPLFATVAREIDKYFDPDDPQYRYDSDTGYSTATPRSTITPVYLEVNNLSQEDQLNTLLATSALPLGITPRRKGRHAVSPEELIAVLEAEAKEYSKLLLSRTFAIGSHTPKVFLIDGGVVDNRPWYPFIEDKPCDQIVIVGCNPVKDLKESKMREEWTERNRLLRIVKSSLQYDERNNDIIFEQERGPVSGDKFIVEKDGVVTRHEQQVVWDFKPVKGGNVEGIKNNPPRIFSRGGGPANWPQVVVIAPDSKLGTFLTGTLNFSSQVAKNRMGEGYEKARGIIADPTLLAPSSRTDAQQMEVPSSLEKPQ